VESCSAEVLYVRSNIADPARAVTWRSSQGRFGRLNLLANNAGIAPRTRTDILEATEESFDEVSAPTFVDLTS